MKSIRRFVLLSAALAVGIPAAAQSVDATSTPPTGNAGFASHNFVPNTGAPKVQLYDNGPYITQMGVGAGGADVSEIEPGLNLFGWGHQFTLGYRIADDFNVPAADTWTLTNLRWLAYQTNATTAGSITGTYQEYVANDPNNAVVLAGDTTTNRLQSATWTGVYRVTSTSLTNTQRALIEVTADASFVPPLATGNYWIRTMCDGTLTSGPWCPVTVPWDATDNNHQELGLGAGFNPTTQGFGGTPGDNPFFLDGTSSGGGGAPTYCTARVSSCGSTPKLGGPSASLSISGGSGSYDVTLIDVPDAPAGGPAVLIHSPTANPTGAPTNFGLLCVTGFFRGPAVGPPAAGGGGICDGTYTWDFGAYVAANAGSFGLVAGNPVNVQGWARDPANAANPPNGTANFSDAIGPVNLTP